MLRTKDISNISRLFSLKPSAGIISNYSNYNNSCVSTDMFLCALEKVDGNSMMRKKTSPISQKKVSTFAFILAVILVFFERDLMETFPNK